MSLTNKQKEIVIEKYLAGEPAIQIAKNMDISPALVYYIIKRNGIQAHKPYKKEKKRSFCLICGQEILPPPSQRNGSARQWNMGAWRRTLTCGHDQCKSIISLRPELIPDNHPYRKWRRGYNANNLSLGNRNKVSIDGWQQDEVDDSVINDLLSYENTSESEWESVKDSERGVEVPEAAKNAPWSPLMQLGVAIRTVNNEGAQESFSVKLRKNESVKDAFVRLYFGGDAYYAEQFEALLAWRCCCAQQTRLDYASLDDLPSEKGYYGVCPQCGSIGLEVL